VKMSDRLHAQRAADLETMVRGGQGGRSGVEASRIVTRTERAEVDVKTAWDQPLQLLPSESFPHRENFDHKCFIEAGQIQLPQNRIFQNIGKSF
jgi:hypothetical protein